MPRTDYQQSLDIAANQYKLALQVCSTPHLKDLQTRIVGFSFGAFSLDKADVELGPNERAIAGSALQHCAEFTMSVAIDTALENSFSDRFNSHDSNIAMASRIARIIRNAFAHDPFFPKWNCTNPSHIGRFEIPGVIEINTTSINGLDVDWQHYGGPLALLKFLRHCQSLIASAVNAV